MLNVPDRIKELLHTDSVNKNIRIHFPNGERTDICNDQIVQDSVQFTESLCSQNTLKFGLCEAPMFQCTVVGVSNITGATIEVFCEIFCESSVEDAEWKNDLEAYIYSIPYGTFIIDSAKRQADLNHRKIAAYGGTSQINSGLGIVESEKFDHVYSSSFTYQPNMFRFLLGNIGMRNYSESVFDVTDVQPSSTSGSGTSQSWDYDGHHYEYRYSYSVKTWYFGGNTLSESDNLFCIDADVNTKKVIDNIKAFLKSYGCPDEKITLFILLFFNISWNNGGIVISYADGIEMPFVFYPYLSFHNVYINMPYSVTVSIYTSNYPQTFVDRIVIDDFATNISLKKLEEKNHLYDDLSFTYATTEDDGSYYLTLPSDFNAITLLNSLMEFNGIYGYLNRDGAFEMLNIKQQFGLLPDTDLYPNTNLYPQGVTGGELLPNDYQSCWYDDDYTLPFGRIRCQYKNTNNNDKTFDLYLTGFSALSPTNSYKTYDFSDNAIIKAFRWTKAQIRSICQSIAANILGVTYMPVDFVGRGLPYVEAGDTFEILTKSNDSITTIVLNRTLTGEQHLTDSYKSV